MSVLLRVETQISSSCVALLSAAMNLAVVEGLIRKNPCDGVKIVRPEHEEEYRGHALNPEECERLLAVARNRWLFALIYTALATGMREAELIGLRWNNVILTGTRPRIQMVEQYKVVRGEGRWQKTKNRKCRDIELDGELLAVLMAGARYAEVSEMLGHSSVKVTQNIYTHALPRDAPRGGDRPGPAAEARGKCLMQHRVADRVAAKPEGPGDHVDHLNPLRCGASTCGANAGARTPDLLFTKQLLYQLSYIGIAAWRL